MTHWICLPNKHLLTEQIKKNKDMAFLSVLLQQFLFRVQPKGAEKFISR